MVLDDLAAEACGGIVDYYFPDASDGEYEGTVNGLISRFNDATEQYAGCKELFYDNPMYKVDESSGMWLLYTRLCLPEPLTDYWDWFKFVGLLMIAVEGANLDQVPRLIEAARA